MDDEIMKPTDKRVIEIADFMFANPQALRKDVLVHFGKVWQSLPISTRTIDRLTSRAKSYNENRIDKQETAKEKALIKSAEKQAERQAMTRDEAMQILESIANGKAKKLPTKSEMVNGKETPTNYEIIYPSERDRIAAIAKLADMQGWDAPKRQEIQGNFLNLSLEVIDIQTAENVKNILKLD